MSQLSPSYLMEAGGQKKNLNRVTVLYNKLFGKGGVANPGSKTVPYDTTFYVKSKNKNEKGDHDYSKVTMQIINNKSEAQSVIKEAITFVDLHILPLKGKNVNMSSAARNQKESIQNRLKKIRLKGSDGVEYTLGKITTSEEFGGMLPGSSAGGAAEMKATEALDSMIEEIKKKTGMPYAKIQIPGCSGPNGASYFKISKVLNTQKQTDESDFVKADLTGLDEKGKPILFISYKDNAGRRDRRDREKMRTLGKPLPAAFNQYGGISASKSPEVHFQKQTQDFLLYLKAMYGDHNPLLPNDVVPIGMPITGKGAYAIKMKAIFGGNWIPKWSGVRSGAEGSGPIFNAGNCQLVFQGRFEVECINSKAKPENQIFKFKKTAFNHFTINNANCNPDKLGGYEPIFLARTGEGTRKEPISGLVIRAGIFPRSAVNVKTMLDPVEVDKVVKRYKEKQKGK